MAAIRHGLTGTDWSFPILKYREAVTKSTDSEPWHLFPKIIGKWEEAANTPPTYGAASHRFRLILKMIGKEVTKTYTLHGLRNYSPTTAAQQGFSEAELSTLGRWVEGGGMANYYDRSICSTERRS